MVLATVRQLVNSAHVRPETLIYDVRRDMPPYLLTKVWSEFKDVRFIQNAPQRTASPRTRPTGIIMVWRPRIGCPESSTPTQILEAKLIAKQVFNATYIVNEALLKAHSYPFNTMEDGDSGQTPSR